MDFVMLSDWPNGMRFDPLVAATVIVGIVTAAVLVAVF
jgi:hypothetical protein